MKWSDPDWSYMLGVIHGDGSVAPRSITVTVSYREPGYADSIVELWERLGYSPKIYRPRSAMSIQVHSAELARLMRQYKDRGRWSWPRGLNQGEYLSGVIDTDGHVTKLPRNQIVIVLKRSGNLERLSMFCKNLGLRDMKVSYPTTNYQGRLYECERLVVGGMDRILTANTFLRLRHPCKAERLAKMVQHIHEIKSRVALWKRIGLWLQTGGPRSWVEIAEEFGLKKDQVAGALQKLRRNGHLETIPPPEAYSKYRVSGL